MPDNQHNFLDTNILLYLISADKEKKKTALSLCSSGNCISINVLNEYSNVCRKKLFRTIEEIGEDISFFERRLSIIYPSLTTTRHALDIGKNTGFSHFDCLVLASALEADCGIFYSEDLQHQRRIENKIEIVNPFI